MTRDHDRESGFLAAASEAAVANQKPPGVAVVPALEVGVADALADVLQGVKLTGALFFLVEATSPWCVEIPEAEQFAGVKSESMKN